jgi:hypothetical protein
MWGGSNSSQIVAMRLRASFFEWTGGHGLGVLGLVLMTPLIFFAWLNIGGGPARETVATVRTLGTDTGTKRSLPRVIATVETEVGERVAVELPTTAPVTEGSRVLIQKVPRSFSGSEYTYLRPAT